MNECVFDLCIDDTEEMRCAAIQTYASACLFAMASAGEVTTDRNEIINNLQD